MTIERVRGVAALSALASRNSTSYYRAAIALSLLTSFASPACAFSPAPPPGSVASVPAVRASVRSSRAVDGRHFAADVGCTPPWRLFASEGGDSADGGNASKLKEDGGEDDDELDAISQRLRRNAESGPIDPTREHDRMARENEDEAVAAADSGINRNATSTLYSYALAGAVDPDLDPASSADEAYVEQLKDLLSRGEGGPPLSPSSEEAKSEERLAKKEAELQSIADEARAAGSRELDDADLERSRAEQSEILARARGLQSEIDRLHADDCGAVLLANLAFYEAFSLRDPEGMADAWWQSPGVVCVHPSHLPLVGSNAVLGSFKAMFEKEMKGSRAAGRGSAGASGRAFMTPTNIRGLSVRGTTASLVCDEEVYSRASPGESASKQGAVVVNKLLASNVFRKVGGRWKMVHRHASWHPETKAAREAARSEPGVAMDDDEQAARSGARPVRSEGMTLRKSNGEGTSRRPPASPRVPPSLEGLDADAVLGIPAPVEEEVKKPDGAGVEGIIGKVINLSDLLGGDDKKGESEGDDEGVRDAISDMIMGSGSDSTSTTGSGTPEDPFITTRVIKIGPGGLQSRLDQLRKVGKKSDDDNDKEADDGEENVVIDLRGKSGEEQKEVMSRVMDGVLGAAPPSGGDGSDSPVPDTSAPRPRDIEGGPRRECIAALRKLAESGQLSPGQKRILLTDIIASTGRGETSLVEVAHGLLVSGTGSPELDVAMEDFAEQCRVFAAAGEE